jgi:uncharacterized protein involved in cysteine biosynthesis
MLAPIQDFFSGVFAPIEGWRLLTAHPSIRRWATAPFLVSLLILSVCIVLTWNNLPYLSERVVKTFSALEWMSSLTQPAEDASWWSRVTIKIAAGTVSFLIKLFLLLSASILGFVISTVICSVLWEIVAMKTLRAIHSKQIERPKQSWLRNTLVSMGREVLKASVLIAVSMIIWTVSLVPVVGTFVAFCAAPFLVAGVYAFTLVDYAMSNENLPLSQRLLWSIRSMPFLVGAGLVAYVPILNLLFLPVLVPGIAKGYDLRRTRLGTSK